MKSTLTRELRQARERLLLKLRVPAMTLRASYVTQYLTCGKTNCRCHQGRKHGPFAYLVQHQGSGQVMKFLLKTHSQRKWAKDAITAYRHFQKTLEQISQINTELLRRGENLED